MIKIKQYQELIILIAVSFFFFLSQFSILQNFWEYSFDDGTYSHAYLIPFISAFLYWQLHKENLLTVNKKINIVALVTLTISTALVLIFSFAHFSFGYRLFFVVAYMALIASVFKPSIKVLFPAFYLVFLVPIWGALIAPLQNLSTFAVTKIMSLTTIPVFVDGNFITIPVGIFEIAGGCSGLRYMIVSLGVSSLYIFLNIRSWGKGITFLTLAILGALLTNWIRITLLILIGNYTNMESGLMEDHNTFGWYIYIPFIIILFAFGNRYLVSTEKEEKVVKQDKPINKVSIAIPSLIIFCTSTYLWQMLYPVKTIPQTCNTAILEGIPLPTIANESVQCVVSEGNKTQVTYFFGGAELDSAVNYYANEFIPNDFKIVKTTSNDEQLIVTDGLNEFTVEMLFKSGDTPVRQYRDLNKTMLLNAFTGTRDTSLIWEVSRQNSEK